MYVEGPELVCDEEQRASAEGGTFDLQCGVSENPFALLWYHHMEAYER